MFVLKLQRYTRIQEFEVLGQTPLSSLKELFSCPSDHVCNHNFAENPDEPVGKIAKVCCSDLICVRYLKSYYFKRLVFGIASLLVFSFYVIYKQYNCLLAFSSQDIYKSNFFFIEGTFYNDMGDKKNVDLSALVLCYNVCLELHQLWLCYRIYL